MSDNDNERGGFFGCGGFSWIWIIVIIVVIILIIPGFFDGFGCRPYKD